jgi:magnesium chelatase family protein
VLDVAMYGQITTFTFVGVEARPIDVQVRLSGGKFNFAIVGLPDKAVAESRERVCNALQAVGLGLPNKRVAVNLSPADLPKEGSHFDLPIALAILVAIEAVAPDAVAGLAAIGELALDGSVRAVPGALPAAVGANGLGKGLICPAANGGEAAWAAESMTVLAAAHLLSLVNHFNGRQPLRRPEPNVEPSSGPLLDLRDVRGQEAGKRALEVAAAGGHNLLFIGPPGSGKSMLAARLPSILPPLSVEEMLEVSMVHSLAGALSSGRLQTERPFRAPHHSASMAALVGGGTRARPGEASLAHHGVLFLDELPEFHAQALDALRQPLEAGETIIARANHRVTYPARFQLVAAMNPCKCGGGTAGTACKRGPRCAADYQARLSGPFLDRMDLVLDVPAVSAADLVLPPPAEGSAEVRARVLAARERQLARFSALGLKGVRINAHVSGHTLEQVVQLAEDARALLATAAQSMGLTARGFHRTLRVARTLADLDGCETTNRMHVAEALSYRGESTWQREVGGRAAA